MVNTTDICRMAISIGILMTLSSSVPQTTREKVSIETVYADRVEYSDRVGKVYTDRFALPPSQPSEAYYCDSSGCIRDRIALPPLAPPPPDGRAWNDRFLRDPFALEEYVRRRREQIR
jgi:hypothetical protein